MRKSLFLISLALSSAACSQSEDAIAPSGVVAESRASVTANASATAVDGPGGSNFEDDSSQGEAKREFSYSWPAEVSAVPQLVRRFEEERDRELAAQKAEWQESLESSPEDCVSCRSRGFEKEWKVVSDLPDWLSLSADLYVYTGGAHGNHGRTSLVWDRSGKRALEGIELFNSPVELETALGARLCDTLDEEREERRGTKVDRNGEGYFNDCPGIDEASVFVGSSNGQTFDRIGVYFGPYVAGPYAEGAYELDFPVTASVLDAVKPEYARAFSVQR